MKLPDSAAVTAIIRAVAAEQIMPRFRRLGRDDVREKGPGDLVTVADEASERSLGRQLRDLLPGSVVLGEEGYAADPGVLSLLTGEAPVWIIDPLDGTSNFAAGRPIFGVLVALVRGGRTLAGWIHDPLADRTVACEAGGGSWLAGQRLQVQQQSHPAVMTGACAGRFTPPPPGPDGRPPALFAGSYNLNCAAHEYLRLLTGEGHFSLYHRLMPWDHAAGVLAHAEAGGFAARFDGSPYHPTDRDGGLLLAPNPTGWQRLRPLLLGDAA